MSSQIIFGHHAVLAQLHGGNVMRLWLQQGRADKRIEMLIGVANKHKVSYELVDKAALEKMVVGVTHQGVMAECCVSTLSESEGMAMLADMDEDPLLLVLDGVQDPHNLGACMRTALAAGVHAVIIPKDKAVGLTPVVIKVACGAVGQVPLVRVTNLARALSKLKDRGIWLYGAAEEGDASLYTQKLTGPIAWVMGAEGRGLRRLTRECCDVLCSIPTYGGMSSLNVSVATGVCLFESQRQRGQTSGL